MLIDELKSILSEAVEMYPGIRLKVLRKTTKASVRIAAVCTDNRT
jgi:hypothetical protein